LCALAGHPVYILQCKYPPPPLFPPVLVAEESLSGRCQRGFGVREADIRRACCHDRVALLALLFTIGVTFQFLVSESVAPLNLFVPPKRALFTDDSRTTVIAGMHPVEQLVAHAHR
jgi:hypothetical protein